MSSATFKESGTNFIDTKPKNKVGNNEWSFQDQQQAGGEDGYVTKTVTGFLDFVTTVGNTVMVFTPQAGVGKNETWPTNEQTSDI